MVAYFIIRTYGVNQAFRFVYIERVVRSDFFPGKNYFTSYVRIMFWATILYQYHGAHIHKKNINKNNKYFYHFKAFYIILRLQLRIRTIFLTTWPFLRDYCEVKASKYSRLLKSISVIRLKVIFYLVNLAVLLRPDHPGERLVAQQEIVLQDFALQDILVTKRLCFLFVSSLNYQCKAELLRPK